MERKGKTLYTNAFDYKVCGLIMRDRNSSRVSIEVYVVSPEDVMSDIITLTRKDVISKRDWANVFYDFGCYFTNEDVDHIKSSVKNAFGEKGFPTETTQEKATMQELHMKVSSYIRENKEELKDNDKSSMFIKDRYGYMATGCMDVFVKKNKEMGYKRLEVLKRLKVMGALQSGNGRAYDVQVSINGKKRRYYKIELAEETEGREENGEKCEVIAV